MCWGPSRVSTAPTWMSPAPRRGSNQARPARNCPPSGAATIGSMAPGVLRPSWAPSLLLQPGLVLLCNLGHCRFSSNAPPQRTHTHMSRDLSSTNRTSCVCSPRWRSPVGPGVPLPLRLAGGTPPPLHQRAFEEPTFGIMLAEMRKGVSHQQGHVSH